jgi:zinc finger protein
LRLDSLADFERQVVKNDSAIFRIEDLDLEMPPGQGQLTNIEGIMSKILMELEADQPQRKRDNFPLYEALDGVIQKIIKMMNGCAFPFSVSVDDPSGNSLIEPSTSDKGPKYIRTDYPRTHAQNMLLGLAADEDDEDDKAIQAPDAMDGVDIIDGQIYEIPSLCPGCSKDCTVNIKKVNIPHFKEVIIMSTVCEHCGYTTREVKTGGEIPDKGQRITLHVENVADLSRDILKSETAALKSPELGLEVQPGTLGGRFTTVEGLLTQVRDQLHGQIFDTGSRSGGGVDSLAAGDSMPTDSKRKWDVFFHKVDQAINAEMAFSIVLEDPLANSYVQSLAEQADQDDAQLRKVYYERTEEEIDDLGLNHMQTEGYEVAAVDERPLEALRLSDGDDDGDGGVEGAAT